MIRRPRKRPLVAFAVGVSVLGLVLAYFALARHLSPAFGAVLSLVPPALIVLATARRAPHARWLWGGVALAAFGLAWRWDLVERHFAGLFLVDHVGLNLALAYVFGRTLVHGRDPLCSAFARAIHGAIPPEVERYTRRVTVAWTVFFLAVCALSLVLYAAGLHTAWSLLATVASPILVALMFIVEYMVRSRVLPHIERVGVLGGIVAFSRHFAARAQAPR